MGARIMLSLRNMSEHVPLELYIVFTEYERTLRINYNAIGPPPLGTQSIESKPESRES